MAWRSCDLLDAVVEQSIARASVVSVQLVPSVAVTAIAARRVVADVMTTGVVLFAFVHVCVTTQTFSSS